MLAGLVSEGSIPADLSVLMNRLNWFASSFAIAPFRSQAVNFFELMVFVSRDNEMNRCNEVLTNLEGIDSNNSK